MAEEEKRPCYRSVQQSLSDMPTAILPQLSRRHKARDFYCNQSSDVERHRKKRKRSSTETSFQVRDCPHGIGMFATRMIGCGEVIIANEEPIVSTRHKHATKDLFCENCAAPLRNLRCHVLGSISGSEDIVGGTNQSNLHYDHLPFLGKDDGVTFVRQGIQCHYNDEYRGIELWCSERCAHYGNEIHQFLHQRSSQHSKDLSCFFVEVESNGPIFKLAMEGITRSLIICLENLQLSTTSSSSSQGVDIEALLWWRDYGSHPLWWEVGNENHATKRRSETSRFCALLRSLLEVSIDNSNTFRGSSTNEVRTKIKKVKEYLDICSLGYVGELLGMLECNVMEFEYPSPLQQYLEHLEMKEEEEDLGDSAILKGGKACPSLPKTLSDWTEHFENKLHDNVHVGPIVGSALYPLLTLANHSCDPNASIDFLGESNRGSMVALRDIAEGEEICITYVPNGDFDAGGSSSRFDAFSPTRTWAYLSGLEVDDSDCDIDNRQIQEDRERNGLEAQPDSDDETASQSQDEEQGDSDEQSQSLQDDEGVSWRTRSEALIEYGFKCECRRCLHEQTRPNEPYIR